MILQNCGIIVETNDDDICILAMNDHPIKTLLKTLSKPIILNAIISMKHYSCNPCIHLLLCRLKGIDVDGYNSNPSVIRVHGFGFFIKTLT